MKVLSVDIETFSEVNIKSGLFKYAANAEIILFGYSVDYGPPECVDLTKPGARIPKHILDALLDPAVKKTAHNAPFEIELISQYLGVQLPVEQWYCSSVLAANGGYPLSLDEASKAIGTVAKKDSEGKGLIRYFCVPCTPTKTNGMRTRNLPCHAPEKWARFIEYCKQDIVTEQAINTELAWLEISDFEHELWCLDQKINKRGWKVDLGLVRAALKLDKIFRERLIKEAKEITGLVNPNSVAQLREWVLDVEPTLVAPDLTAPTVDTLLGGEINDKRVRRVLEIRQELGKTSIKKYAAMLAAVSDDGRVRGLFQFYGAGRTGRWAGRLVQVQNLPRISMKEKDLMDCRRMVKELDADMIDLLYGSLSKVLSQLIRTTFIGEKGHRLIISDFSAIEARVLAWVAGEEWVLEVFRTHGMIYEATAANMRGITIEEVTKAERQRGKVATLALGYGGGIKALEKMGALKMGVPEEELQGIVNDWREANPNIVKFWRALEKAAIQAITTGAHVKVGNKGISFKMKKGTLLLYLPSGRSLMYPNARMELIKQKIALEPVYALVDGIQVRINPKFKIKERNVITFDAVDGYTRKWGKSHTYGGKLAENVCQAIARDCLANAMLNLDKVGVNIVATVHDEVIAEMPNKVTSLQEINRLMVKPVAWMKGLPLGAAGDESEFYNK